MIYKCAYCKTTKLFDDPAPTETAFCVVCQCSRLFSPDASSKFEIHPYVRPSASISTFSRTSEKRTSSLHPSHDHLDFRNHRSSPKLGARPISGVARSSSMSSIRPCDYFKLCLEYMLSLDCKKPLFNRQYNRCYCENCYSPTSKDFHIEGGAKYVIPRGWVRFGLYIDNAQAKAEDVWKNWVVSYHGTSPGAAKSIIEHHQFLLPGDQCIDGHVIGIRPDHIPGKFQVYTSPTIAYSGDDIYSPSFPFRSKITGKSYRAKIVLQCRQQPKTFKIQAETINAGNRRICPIIPNSEVEYFTEVRSSIIPYGLLIRVF